MNAPRPVPAATANEKGAAPVVDPAARSDRPVTAEEKIKFEQDKAHAHMRELEGRMFRVAELLRPTQPDDSAFPVVDGGHPLAGAASSSKRCAKPPN